jgi:hypothetical protein
MLSLHIAKRMFHFPPLSPLRPSGENALRMVKNPKKHAFIWSNAQSALTLQEERDISNQHARKR